MAALPREATGGLGADGEGRRHRRYVAGRAGPGGRSTQSGNGALEDLRGGKAGVRQSALGLGCTAGAHEAGPSGREGGLHGGESL